MKVARDGKSRSGSTSAIPAPTAAVVVRTLSESLPSLSRRARTRRPSPSMSRTGCPAPPDIIADQTSNRSSSPLKVTVHAHAAVAQHAHRPLPARDEAPATHAGRRRRARRANVRPERSTCPGGRGRSGGTGVEPRPVRRGRAAAASGPSARRVIGLVVIAQPRTRGDRVLPGRGRSMPPVGFVAEHAVEERGLRIDPPTSEPRPNGEPPAPTIAPSPPELLPPTMRSGSYGLLVRAVEPVVRLHPHAESGRW